MNNIKQSNKLTVRDFATIGIFSVLVQVIQVSLGVVTSPFVLYSFVFFTAPIALLCAPIYMLMAVKVGKPGVLLIFNIIRGLLFVVFGAPALLIWFVISGVVCEIIMFGGDAYKSFVRNCIGWVVASVFYGLHLVIVIKFLRPVFESMISGDKLKTVEVYLTSPMWISITLVSVIICAIIGCFISKRLIKKHFKRSGIM